MLSNAIKYSKTSSKIILTVSSTTETDEFEEVLIKVKDFGLGIKDEEK